MILVFLKLQEMKKKASQAETQRGWCNNIPPTCDPQLCSAHFRWVPILISKSVNPSPGHPVCPTTNSNHSFFLTESAISFPISEDTLDPSYAFFHVFPDHFLTELPSVTRVVDCLEPPPGAPIFSGLTHTKVLSPVQRLLKMEVTLR